MKTRRTKFLLSFLAVAILGFALVNAFTIEVQNRDPFGTLNLSTLRIKPNANSSGTMELSGYTLQIRTASGQINVHKICDENGSGCKEVSTLGIGGSGGGIVNEGNLIISGSNLQRCRYRDVIIVTGNNGEIYEIEAPIDNEWLNERMATNIDNPNYPQNLGLKYYGKAISYLSGDDISDSLTGRIKCTYDNIGSGLGSGIVAFGTGGEICSLITGGDLSGNLICDNSVLQVLSGTIAQLVAMFRKTNTNPEYEFPAIVTSGTKWGHCYLADETGGNIECDNRILEDVIRQLLLFIRHTKNNPGSGFEYDPTFSGYEYDGSGYVIYPGLTVSTTGANMGYYCSSTDGNTLQCNNANLRKYQPFICQGGQARTFITPNTTNDIMLHGDLYHSGAFVFRSYHGELVGSQQSQFTFDARGIRIGSYAASISTGDGLSVGGMIAVGENNHDNYIYMYATGNNDDIDRHYEIMGNEQLAIGTKAGAFIYFTQRTGTYYTQLKYGSGYAVTGNAGGQCYAYKYDDGNSNYTLVAGGGNGSQQGGGGGGGDNTPFPGHLGDSIPLQCGMEKEHAYKSLMVGVNTNAPQATLDVNGSIRVGSNCVSMGTTCSGDNVGTMMYMENDSDSNGYLIMCIKQGGNYIWYDIIHGTGRTDLSFGNLENGNWDCYLPKPTPGVYPGFTGQVDENNPIMEY